MSDTPITFYATNPIPAQDYAAELTRLRAALDEALEVVEPFARPQNPQALPRDFDAARRFYEKHKGGE